MLLELEGGNKIENPTIEDVYKELELLGKKGKTYLYLNADNGSYIQIGGKAKACVVEVRVVNSPSEFKHWSASRVDKDSEVIEVVTIGGAKVKVKEKQILDVEMAKVLFKSFYDGEFLSKEVNWVDITSMFI